MAALDNLKVTANGMISSVCWWGVYYDFGTASDCGPGTGDDFTITYYNDDSCKGVPGSLRAGPFSIGAATKVATGNFASYGGLSMAEYQYEATHPPVAVSTGECLWIEILNHTTQNCFWLWGTSAFADGLSIQGGIFGYTTKSFDLAFCVDVVTASNGCAPSIATSYCTAKVNSSGCTPNISASILNGHLMLDSKQILPGQIGLLFYSTQGAAGVPFQGGYLCVQPPVTRTASKTSGTAGAPPCSGTSSFDFTAYVASGVDPALVVGQQVWAQYWSRDGGASFGTGLTDALTFTLCP